MSGRSIDLTTLATKIKEGEEEEEEERFQGKKPGEGRKTCAVVIIGVACGNAAPQSKRSK